MTEAQKTSLYSIADLKNTSDDAIPNYLNSLKFKQNHFLSDVRLALGYTAFAVSAAAFYWDYKLGFDSTKYYTAAAVVVYACLNGALMLWIWSVEGGKVYVGKTPRGDGQIEISSSVQKHVPIYSLKIVSYTFQQPSMRDSVEISRPFTQWFDEAGHFVALPFQQMLAAGDSTIGEADPTKAVPMKGKLLQTTAAGQSQQPRVDRTTAGRGTGALVSEVDNAGTPRKGAKSRKKL